MAEPVSTTVAVAAAVSFAMKGAGMLFGGKAQKQAARRQMEMMKKQAIAARDQSLYNARIASLNRDITLANIGRLNKQEKLSIGQTKEKMYKTLDAQKISYAASGFSQASGSLSAIEMETMKENSLETQAIRDSFNTGRWNIRAKAQQFQMEADRFLEQAIELDPMNNNYGMSNSMYNASLLTGAGDLGMDMINFFG